MSSLPPSPVPEGLESSATVVLLRDAPGLEVFLMRRAVEASVLGGVHVFPGGKVDAADRAFDPARLDRSAGDLHAALAEPELSVAQAVALHVAALRELLEEAGVTLPVSAVAPWSRWITPVIPDMPRRRFDTRFFVAKIPATQTAAVSDRESTEGCWLAPRAALEGYWRGDIVLAPPQLVTLAHLSRFAQPDAAFDDAQARAPRLIHPVCRVDSGARIFCYPGDADHPEREPAFPGVSRLLLCGERFEPIDGFEGFFR